MIWLEKAMVDTFHRESLALFSGADGLRDEGLLLSALPHPQNALAYEPDTDVFRLATFYAHGIVKNHPFVDGNKRTALLSAIAFLALNHVQLELDEPEIVVMVLGLASGEVNEKQFADWLRHAAVKT